MKEEIIHTSMVLYQWGIRGYIDWHILMFLSEKYSLKFSSAIINGRLN